MNVLLYCLPRKHGLSKESVRKLNANHAYAEEWDQLNYYQLLKGIISNVSQN